MPNDSLQHIKAAARMLRESFETQMAEIEGGIELLEQTAGPIGSDEWFWPVMNPAGETRREIRHPFGESRPTFGANHLHEGADILALDGWRIVAASDGIISKMHSWAPPSKKGSDAYGNWLIIAHLRGDYSTAYCHLADFAPGLAVGMPVRAGSDLGAAGTTGNSTGIHLHFMVLHALKGMDGFVFPKVLDPAPLIGAGRITAPANITNQIAINRIYAIAQRAGMAGWNLIETLGWQDMALPFNRPALFDLQRIFEKSGSIRDDIWMMLVQALEK